MPLTPEPGFHDLRLAAITPLTADAAALTFEPAPADRERFGFEAGQYLTLRAEIGGQDLRRTYSLCVPPQSGLLRIAIKRQPQGVFSNWALGTLRPGDGVQSMPPRGGFTVPFAPGRRRRYLALAAGSGITPILSLLSAGLLIERDSRFVLLYGNRTSSSIMFLDEIAALKDRFLDRLQVVHVLAAEADEVALLNGRLDQDRIAALLATLGGPAPADLALVCGPEGMMDAAERALREAGVDPAAILLERFGAPRRAAPVGPAPKAQERVHMRVELDGRTRTVPFDPALGNILDSVRAAGLPAPFACKAGVCATCRARLRSGEVAMAAHYGLSDEEIAAGYILTCQASPAAGSELVIDYDC